MAATFSNATSLKLSSLRWSYARGRLSISENPNILLYRWDLMAQSEDDMENIGVQMHVRELS
jgi:hypothetical protein